MRTKPQAPAHLLQKAITHNQTFFLKNARNVRKREKMQEITHFMRTIKNTYDPNKTPEIQMTNGHEKGEKKNSRERQKHQHLPTKTNIYP